MNLPLRCRRKLRPRRYVGNAVNTIRKILRRVLWPAEVERRDVQGIVGPAPVVERALPRLEAVEPDRPLGKGARDHGQLLGHKDGNRWKEGLDLLRHFLPDAAAQFPALMEVPHLEPLRALVFSSVIYCIWQGLYWQFVYVGRKAKVESGQRVTSLSYLLADRRGAIGRALSKIPEGQRVSVFMIGQFGESSLVGCRVERELLIPW